MKTKDQIVLGIEDLKNMRCPWPLKVVFLSIIPAIVLLVFFLLIYNYQKIQSYDWIPIILIIQTIIILIQVKIIRTQSKYSKLPYIPEFDLETCSGLKQDKQKKQYQTSVRNKGDIAHRVDCKVIYGKGGMAIGKLFFEKIPNGGIEIILDLIEEDRFIKQPIRINFSYYDKVGNHIFSRWFKDEGKDKFIVILSGQER